MSTSIQEEIEIDKKDLQKSNPLIKHLVISGGGPAGIKILGILQQLEIDGFWNIATIETIYGTSIGAAIAVLLALKFDWTTLNEYMVNRPWHEAYHIHINQIFDAFSKRGIFDRNAMDIFFKPIFSAKDVPLDITLMEFYSMTRIEIHIFSLDINHFQKIDISYKTYPHLSVLSAVQMSCAIPLLISPVCIDGMCCLDGGILCNYALNECIENGASIDEILGIKNKYLLSNKDSNIVNETSTILDYIITFISKLIYNVKIEKITCIPHEVLNEIAYLSFYNIRDAIMSKEVRQQLLYDGIETAKIYLSSITSV